MCVTSQLQSNAICKLPNKGEMFPIYLSLMVHTWPTSITESLCTNASSLSSSSESSSQADNVIVGNSPLELV